MFPTLFPATDSDGLPMTADWDAHRFFWIGGSAFTGKTTAVKTLVEGFEAQGGEALVFIDFAPEARHYPTKLYTFSAERDMIPTIEELTELRLTSDGHAPLLIVIEDWDGEISDELTTRFLQVARHAERLNAWVLVTSGVPLVAPDFVDLEPKRFWCQHLALTGPYYIHHGIKPDRMSA